MPPGTGRAQEGSGAASQAARGWGREAASQEACAEQRREEEAEQMGKMTKRAPLNASRPWYHGNLHRVLMEVYAKRKFGFFLLFF